MAETYFSSRAVAVEVLLVPGMRLGYFLFDFFPESDFGRFRHSAACNRCGGSRLVVRHTFFSFSRVHDRSKAHIHAETTGAAYPYPLLHAANRVSVQHVRARSAPPWLSSRRVLGCICHM